MYIIFFPSLTVLVKMLQLQEKNRKPRANNVHKLLQVHSSYPEVNLKQQNLDFLLFLPLILFASALTKLSPFMLSESIATFPRLLDRLMPSSSGEAADAILLWFVSLELELDRLHVENRLTLRK